MIWRSCAVTTSRLTIQKNEVRMIGRERGVLAIEL